MKSLKLILLILFGVNCFGQNNNASVKKPSIFIIPSDNLLLQLRCYEIIDIDGEKKGLQDYKKAFRENSDLIAVIGRLEDRFGELNFPIGNLNNEITKLSNDAIESEVEGLRTDAKSRLLQSVRPDIIFELTYEYKEGAFDNSLTFVLSAIDAYSSNSIASISQADIKGSKDNITSLLLENVEAGILDFQKGLMRHFEQVNQFGRQIRLRFLVDKQSDVDLEMDMCGDEYLSDYIQDWVKKNAKNGAFKKQTASSSQILYSEVRIELYDEEGQGLGIEDWIKPIRRDLLRTCGLSVVARSVGVGDTRVIIKK